MRQKPLSFNDYVEEADMLIEKRRAAWTLSTLSFEDAKQHILIRINNKFEQFDPKKKAFEFWCNTLISNAIKNLLRDNLYRFQRPCLKCAYNLGNGVCGYTVNQTQCNQCPIYAGWEARKQDSFNINVPLTIENHKQAVSNLQCDFIDIERAKKIIDEKIVERLDTGFERRMYRMIFFQHKTNQEINEAMHLEKRKTPEGLKGIAIINEFRRKVIVMAREVIEDENLA